VPRFFASMAICLCVIVGVTNAASAQTPDPAFRQDILKLMDVMGVNALGQQMGTMASRQIVEATRKSKPDVSQRALDIITEVVQAKFTTGFTAPKGLRDRMESLYATSFTHDEVRGLLAFYGTDLGRKLLMVMPQIALQTAQLGQQWANELAPEAQAEVQRRLKAEGLQP